MVAEEVKYEKCTCKCPDDTTCKYQQYQNLMQDEGVTIADTLNPKIYCLLKPKVKKQ